VLLPGFVLAQVAGRKLDRLRLELEVLLPRRDRVGELESATTRLLQVGSSLRAILVGRRTGQQPLAEVAGAVALVKGLRERPVVGRWLLSPVSR
jgi:hypothetical protein